MAQQVIQVCTSAMNVADANHVLLSAIWHDQDVTFKIYINFVVKTVGIFATL